MTFDPERLKGLAPREFENLTFDLLVSLGVQNLTWRTPGADGGRDIEGEMAAYDLSGTVTRQKWYVECKRYTAAVDWPTVWKKVAYADNHGADYLLIALTSTLSPDCETEVGQWNAQRKRPAIRSWNVYKLAHILDSHMSVAVRYGLANSPLEKDGGFVSLAAESSKLAHAAYCALEFNQSPKGYLEAGAALSELVHVRMDDIARYGNIHRRAYDPSSDGYSWQFGPPPGTDIDAVALRAALAAFRLIHQAEAVEIHTESNSIIAEAKGSKATHNGVGQSLFGLIALWGDFEIAYRTDSVPQLLITPHKEDVQ